MPKEEALKTPAEHNKTLLEWKAPEFINYPKGKRWFMGAGVLMLVLLSYAIYTGSATMAIVFIVLAGVYVLTHNLNPKIISIKITELGVYVGEDFYPYNMIESFWIVYHPQYYRDLHLKIKNRNTKLTIQLHEQSPAEVRKVLSEEVEEVQGVQENFSDILARLLRL